MGVLCGAGVKTGTQPGRRPLLPHGLCSWTLPPVAYPGSSLLPEAPLDRLEFLPRALSHLLHSEPFCLPCSCQGSEQHVRVTPSLLLWSIFQGRPVCPSSSTHCVREPSAPSLPFPGEISSHCPTSVLWGRCLLGHLSLPAAQLGASDFARKGHFHGMRGVRDCWSGGTE